MCIYLTGQQMVCGLQAKASGGYSQCLDDRVPWQPLLGKIKDKHGCPRPHFNSGMLPVCCITLSQGCSEQTILLKQKHWFLISWKA